MFDYLRGLIIKESLTEKEKCACRMLSRMTYGSNGEYDLSEANKDTIYVIRKMGVDPEKLFELSDLVTNQINGGNWKALL